MWHPGHPGHPNDIRDHVNDNRDNGALASLDLSNNRIFAGVQDEGPAPVLAEALKNCTSLHTLLISSNYMKAIHAKILAPAIQDMGALVFLNLANNLLGPVGAQHLAKVLPTW